MKFIFVILIAMYAIPGISQTTIHGVILSCDSTPFARAKVILLDRESHSHVIGTISDEDGDYQLDALQGNYILYAWSDDFRFYSCMNLDVDEVWKYSDAGILFLNNESVEASPHIEMELSSR